MGDAADHGGERGPRGFVMRVGLVALVTLSASCLALVAGWLAVRWIFSSWSSGSHHGPGLVLALICLVPIVALHYLAARIGARKPHDRPAWFFASFVCTPLVAWLILWVVYLPR